MKRVGVATAVALLASLPRAASAEGIEAPVQDVHHVPVPDASFGYTPVSRWLTPSWLLLQAIPSPELAFGRHRTITATGAVEKDSSPSFGLRWQLTPVLWSFGVHPSQSRWRTFVVDPIARHSGSLELSTSAEYIAGHVDRLIVRPGLRAYLPLVQKGEYLSMSLGTSAYSYAGLRVAYDVGAYFIGGLVGLQVTVAPTHAPLAAITTLSLRYF